jgi:hypothetical protein
MTAVEYIVERMQSGKWEYTPNDERRAIIAEAKQMEKRQAIEFADTFARDYIGYNRVTSVINDVSAAEEFYNQTH